MRAGEGACRGKEMVGHVNGTDFAFNHRWHHLDRFFSISQKKISPILRPFPDANLPHLIPYFTLRHASYIGENAWAPPLENPCHPPDNTEAGLAAMDTSLFFQPGDKKKSARICISHTHLGAAHRNRVWQEGGADSLKVKRRVTPSRWRQENFQAVHSGDWLPKLFGGTRTRRALTVESGVASAYVGRKIFLKGRNFNHLP